MRRRLSNIAKAKVEDPSRGAAAGEHSKQWKSWMGGHFAVGSANLISPELDEETVTTGVAPVSIARTKDKRRSWNTPGLFNPGPFHNYLL
jgi:hypothetical protein